jgi:protein ImuB
VSFDQAQDRSFAKAQVMLWLCLHLPALALEIFARGAEDPAPLAVSEGSGRSAQVVAVNESAHRRGVRPGMATAAAHALASGLRVRARDGVAEREALDRLAAWAYQYTSLVSVVPPQALLLEVQGSLALFGGLERLIERVRGDLATLGYRARLAVAPTPLAATWLARACAGAAITDRAFLAGALAKLALDCLDLAPRQSELLAGMGVRRLGDCLRLPRAGLARRLGPGLVLSLDRALGCVPDPRLPYVPPPRFEARLELPGEVTDTEALLFALKRLLLELNGILVARVAGVDSLVVLLHHRTEEAADRPSLACGPRLDPIGEAADRPSLACGPRLDSGTESRAMPQGRGGYGFGSIGESCIELGLVAPTRDVKRLTELLRERLARVSLAQPVESLTLRASRLLALPGSQHELIAAPRAQAESGAALIERLRARLGARAVQSLVSAADHRPERAWRVVEPDITRYARCAFVSDHKELSAPRVNAGARCALDSGHIQLPSPACGRGVGERVLSASGRESEGEGIPAMRPLWLLPEPLPLDERDGVPWLDGALVLEAGRERIESGWWDGADVRRDYFIARNLNGVRLWVYRSLDGGRGWFLHGVFA